MPTTNWSQDVFSKGELSPLMYSRVTTDAYYKGVKTGQNTITYPQGGIGKRFGTIYENEITGVTDWRDIFFETFQYLNECCYLIVFTPGSLKIYLEEYLVATVATPLITSDIVRTMDWTILDDVFRIAAGVIPPQDIVRSSTNTTINSGAGIVSNQFTLTAATTADIIFPVRFVQSTAPGDVLPTTSPQIREGRTYFAKSDATGLLIKLYDNAIDAGLDANAFTLTNVGVGTTTVYIYNTWTLTPVVFQNLPQYDFVQNYYTYGFTPSSTTIGSSCTITCTNNVFSTAYVGGSILIANGCVSFTTYVSPTQMTGTVISTLSSTTQQLGRLVELREPAWSNTRGWPFKCSSFQNRAVFANTDLLPNGLYLSGINDYNNFDELNFPPDDDDAISYYPSSDTVNVIKFIVPYRSLTVHTNTGVYSTPVSIETALTPKNFSLALQDSTPATAIAPQAVDNQIVILSGNDVQSMEWQGINNAYNSTIASITSEHLIRNPHDETAYVNLNKAGSRYIFIINDDGSLVIYQTLILENVSGFTKSICEQTLTNDGVTPIVTQGKFRWAASNNDGRCWFVVERQIANELVPPFTYSTKYFIEQLSFDVYTDCSYIYSGAATSSIAGLSRYNGQTVVMQGDGYGFSDQVEDSTVEFTAHGQPVEVSEAVIGFAIPTIIQPLPNALPGAAGYKASTLFEPIHIRSAVFMFADTIGGYIDGYPIALQYMSEYNPLGPPVPTTSYHKMSFMKGWNEFLRDPITITHSEPFDIKLIGIYYKLEV